MSEMQSQKKNILILTLTFIVSIALFYFSAPPVEVIQDIEISNGYAYLALGEFGVRVMDISNPDQPVELGKFDTLGYAQGLTSQGDKLYVADGNNGLLVLETSNPAGLKLLWRYGAPADARAVALRGDYLYIADAAKGLYILKTAQFPPNPEEKFSWAPGGSGLKKVAAAGKHIVGITLDNQVHIYNVGDPAKTEKFPSFTLEAEITDISARGSTVFVSTNGRGVFWFRNPSKNTAASDGSFPMEGVNVRSIDLFGNNAYLGISGKGIQILDVADLNRVGPIHDYHQFPEITALKYADGYAYVGDGRKGLKTARIDESYEIATISDPSNQSGILGSIEDIHQVNNFVYMASCQQGINILNLGENFQIQGQNHVQNMSGCAVALDAVNNFLIVALKNRGIQVYDISQNQFSPNFVFEIPTGGATKDVAVKEHFAFVANGSAGLTIVDWELPLDQVIGQLELGEGADALGIHLYGNYAFIAAGSAGLKIVDVTDPRQPILINATDLPGNMRNVYLHPSIIANSEGQTSLYAFVVGGSGDDDSGMWIVDVTDPGNPRPIGNYKTSEPVVDISIDGRAAYLLLEDHGVISLDIGDPGNPQLRWSQGVAGDYARIFRNGRMVFVAKKTEGIQLFQMGNIEAPSLIFEFSTGALVFQDVVFDNYVYAVDAERGLWVIDIADLKNPSIGKFIGTPGTPRDLALIQNKLFLADGGKGIRIYDIDNRSNPSLVGKFEAMHFALAISGRGEFAYVANAQSGMVIFNFSDPANITPIVTFPTRSAALDVASYGNVVYIAEGISGVEVVDVSEPQYPKGVDVTNEFSFGNALSVNVSSSQKRLYVADGEQGLKIFNIENPYNPSLIYSAPSLDRTRDAASLANYTFLADSSGGARVLVSLADATYSELENIPTPASNIYGVDLAPGNPNESHLMVTGDQGGLGIYKITRKIKTSPKGFAEIPGRSQLKEMIPLFAGENPQRGRQSRFMLIGGILGFVLAVNVIRLFLSGLILPVGNRRNSLKLFERLFSYVFGMHGEVVMVEGGKANRRTDAFSGFGPGFVYVDANSAIVLERKAYMPGILGRLGRSISGKGPCEKLTSRTEGPGIVFAYTGEFEDDGIVDLRKQIRFRPGVTAQTRDGIDVSNVVFALCSVGESPDVLTVAYQGEEKSENIRVIQKGWQYPDDNGESTFRVEIISKFLDILDAHDKREVHRFVQDYRRTGKAEPYHYQNTRKVWPPYKFDATRVYSAVTSQPIDVDEQERKHWAELPAHVAVGIYREMLAKRKYDELYSPLMAHTYPLWPFKNELNQRLRLQGILAFQFVCRKDGNPLEEDDVWKESELEKFPKQEFTSQKLLRSRGLKVIAGGFSELKPSLEELQDHYMFEYLMTPWQHDVVVTKADHELQAMRIKNKARAQTQKDLAFTFSKILSSSEHSQEAIALRVFQSLETLAADPETKRLLPGEVIQTIRSIRSLLLPGEDFIV